jgi:hypothetical protein
VVHFLCRPATISPGKIAPLDKTPAPDEKVFFQITDLFRGGMIYYGTGNHQARGKNQHNTTEATLLYHVQTLTALTKTPDMTNKDDS